jgi:hypothetical protein
MKTIVTGKTITFTFDGEESVVFDADAATAHSERAMMHGFEQKIRDNAAISRKQKNGTVITVTEAMRRAAVLEMANHLTTSGDWNMRTSAMPKQNATIAAIAAKLGVSYTEAEAEVQRRMLAEMEG